MNHAAGAQLSHFFNFFFPQVSLGEFELKAPVTLRLKAGTSALSPVNYQELISYFLSLPALQYPVLFHSFFSLTLLLYLLLTFLSLTLSLAV